MRGKPKQIEPPNVTPLFARYCTGPLMLLSLKTHHLASCWPENKKHENSCYFQLAVPILLQVTEKKTGPSCVLVSSKVAEVELWAYAGINEKRMYLTDCGLRQLLILHAVGKINRC